MSMDTLPMTAPAHIYRDRRAKLALSLKQPLVLFGGVARARNYSTNEHPFRAGSNYLYFGGPAVPGAALVIKPSSDGAEGCSLVRPGLGFEDIVWIGSPPDDMDLAAASGVPERNIVGTDFLESMGVDNKGLFLAPPCPESADWARKTGLTPATRDEQLAVINMRLFKDEYELEAMRHAATVAGRAHRAAIKATSPGRPMSEIAADFYRELFAGECDVSFTPIITTNGEILHCEGTTGVAQSGRLLLVDGGAEEKGGYASDLTRTVPVDGTFTPIQRHLYETVLRAEREAISACVPGRRFREIHDLAARVICEGLVAAELLKGSPDDLVDRGAHTLFFIHGLGHLLGLDVHDMEEFGDLAGYAPGRSRRREFGNKYLRLDRDLEPGMTLTIEPGCYLVPAIWQRDELVSPFDDVVNRANVDGLLRDGFGGIRIEDDVLVCVDGPPEVLSQELPSGVDEVIEMMSKK